MKRLAAYRTALALLALGTSFPSAAQAPVHARTLLLGTWTWTRSVNNCAETHTYRPDGSRSSISGLERSDSRYEISNQPSAEGFWKLDVTTIKDYGGKDCADTEADETGLSWSLYLRFDGTGNQLIYCYEQSLNNCYGPFTRAKSGGA
jgi:hypothetical protein